MEARFFLRGTIAPLRLQTLAAAVEPPARDLDAMAALHDPPLEPRDEAVFLLTAAAEIEHALMVQYLYAAYSLRVRARTCRAADVKNLLVQIAREEMGHLVTVQNLLHLVGGPLNLGRDRAPYASEIYPPPLLRLVGLATSIEILALFDELHTTTNNHRRHARAGCGAARRTHRATEGRPRPRGPHE